MPAAACAAALLAGCGTPSSDLFIVKRSGSIPGARLTLRFDDGGQVRCNGGGLRTTSSQDLIDARDINRKLKDAAKTHLRLAPGKNAVLTYTLMFEKGTGPLPPTRRAHRRRSRPPWPRSRP